jgi:starvation-inducible DNA-binding protein
MMQSATISNKVVPPTTEKLYHTARVSPWFPSVVTHKPFHYKSLSPMKANIGITPENLQNVATELNKILSDEVVLYIKTRNYHWNVEGESFMEMHKFYQSQYEELDEIMDDVAERIRFIGHYSEARLVDYLKLTHLSEPQYTTDRKEQLRNLLMDHEAVIMNLRGLITTLGEKYNDLGSADFVTGLMEKHEKMAWMIRSYLK